MLGQYMYLIAPSIRQLVAKLDTPGMGIRCSVFGTKSAATLTGYLVFSVIP